MAFWKNILPKGKSTKAIIYSNPDEALQDFIIQDDRSDPEHFVGRKDLIETITKDLQGRIRKWEAGVPNPWKGATRLIQGAPGAGKTALLDHLAKILPAQIQSKQPLQICRLNTRLIREPAVWQNALRKAIEPAPKGWCSPGWFQSNKSLSVKNKVEIGHEKIAKFTSETIQSTNKKEIAWNEWFNNYTQQPKKQRPVLLLIDEIQNISSDIDNPQAQALLEFQENTKQLPVLPIYAGLAWSEKHLDSIGLSRLSNNGRVHILGCLQTRGNLEKDENPMETETEEAVRKFIEDPRYQIQYTEEEKQQWMRKIDEESHGWPRHLHAHLNGLARGIASTQGRNLSQLNSKETEKYTARDCNEYYEKRVGNQRLAGRNYLARAGILYIYKNEGRNINVTELSEQIETISKKLSQYNPAFKLPANQTAEQFTSNMVKAGLLHVTGENQVHIPIPSLATYAMTPVNEQETDTQTKLLEYIGLATTEKTVTRPPIPPPTPAPFYTRTTPEPTKTKSRPQKTQSTQTPGKKKETEWEREA